MLACVQLLTSLGVPSTLAWVIDGTLLVTAAAVGLRLYVAGRRSQPSVVAEAERIVADAEIDVLT